MNKQIRWIIVGLLLLSLSSMACALSGGDDEETAVEAITGAAEEAASEAVAEAVEEAGGAEAVAEAVEAITEGAAEAVAEIASGETITAAELGESLDLSSILDGEALQSYQYDMVMDINSDGNNSQSVITVLYNTDPPAMSMVMSFSGDAFAEDAEMGEINMIQIGDSIYMDMPEMGCMQMPATDSNLADEMMSDIFGNEIVDDLETLVKEGNETVNGVETVHYTFDETAFLTADDGMETATGHIYIAKDGGYMVRMIVDGTGNVGDFSGSDSAANGTMRIEMNLTNINEPVNIEAPADCESFGGGFGPDTGDASGGDSMDYPVTDDATDVFAMEGLTAYTTAMSVEDVLAFYRSEMSEMGWTEEGMFGDETTVTTAFMKDGQTVTLAINNESDGVTAVTILGMDQ